MYNNNNRLTAFVLGQPVRPVPEETLWYLVCKLQIFSADHRITLILWMQQIFWHANIVKILFKFLKNQFKSNSKNFVFIF